MTNYRIILKKVGVVLIVIGILDIGFMIYCIVNEANYSSSLNILAVIAGSLLYRGGLKTAKVVAFFSAFFLTATVGIMLVFPIFIPPDLLLTQIKLDPLSSAGYIIVALSFLLFLVWVLKNLTSPEIYAAMNSKGINTKSFFSRPRTGIICGIFLVAILGSTLPVLLRGESAEMAKIEAQKKVGTGYKFVVSSININSNFKGKTAIYAIVTAYNETEIKEVEVKFEK
jgi:hypothetical protein